MFYFIVQLVPILALYSDIERVYIYSYSSIDIQFGYKGLISFVFVVKYWKRKDAYFL